MITGAILAGGQARRFDGRDKSQLLVHGRTMLDRQVEAMRPVVDRLLLVGHGSPRLPADVERVADRVDGCGPLAGLEAALHAGAGRPILLVGCDMPFVTTPLLAFLANALADADAVVPETERGYHPLCAVYAPSCLGAVRRRLASRSLRLRGLFDEVRVRVIRGTDLARFGEPSHLLANVNTRADLDALESLNH